MKNVNFKAILLVICCLFSMSIYGQKERPEYVPGQVLIKMKANRTATQKNTLKNQMNASLQRSNPRSSAEVWTIDQSQGEADIRQLINQYRNHPDIEYIEPNYYYYLTTDEYCEEEQITQCSTPLPHFDAAQCRSPRGETNMSPFGGGEGGGIPENCVSSEALNITPNDPLFTDQWGMNNTGQNNGTPDADIDAPEAWDIATGSPSIVVGLIDTGVDWKHPDLVNNIWQNSGEDLDGDGVLIQNDNGIWIFDPNDIDGIDNDGNGYADDFIGWDFIDNDNDPYDIIGHGTHVAGIIGAEGNNGIGVAGVTWDVQIAALRVFAQRNTPVDVIAEALDYAVKMDMPITNNSYAEGRYSDRMIEALDSAQVNGHLFVAAAGNFRNDNDENPNYPSSYPFDNIISVAATDRDDMLWAQSTLTGSSFGATNVDLAAPGRMIQSTELGGYGNRSGTSMATPHVTGACALIWEQHPDKTYAEIKDAVLNSVDVLPDLSGRCVSGGRLNLYEALTYFSSIPPSISGCRYNDSLALVALYEATDGANWTNTWDLNESMDAWYGVTLTGNGCVAQLQLNLNNLNGTIPAALGTLSQANYVLLGANSLSGNIPAELGNMTSLYSLNLGSNLLGGEIPRELGDLPILNTLRLESNQLSGSIPIELSYLSNLNYLWLYSNELTGIIPSELANLSSLTNLDLGWNDLCGAIPDELTSMTNLATLRLENNNLVGDIPSQLGSMANLTRLYLYNNQLSGCYDSNLASLCSQLNNATNSNVSNGNDFDTPWEDFCNNGAGDCNASCRMTDSLSLVALYNSAEGAFWVNQWDLGQPMDAWYGVTLNVDGCVTELILSNNFLNGWLPAEIGNLEYLNSLELGNNLLFGSIPSEWGNLTSLYNLYLGNNNLSGCYHYNLFNMGYHFNYAISDGNFFDTDWENFYNNGIGVCNTFNQNDYTALKALYLSTDGDNWSNNSNWPTAAEFSANSTIPPNTNMASWHGVYLNKVDRVERVSLNNRQLNGILPTELNSLSELTELSLNGNQLTGIIPATLGDLNKLTKLSLRDNQFTGTIPPELGDLEILKYLWLEINQLSGEVPAELGKLCSLEDLFLYQNQLEGIPAELGNLNNLKRLNISNNELSGEIPAELGSLNNLTSLALYFNQLSGEIPPELGNLSNLTDLWMSANQLSGEIPAELGYLSNLGNLYIHGNQLSGCYDVNLANLCGQINAQPFNNNNLDTEWTDFCNTGAGTCTDPVWPGDYNYDGTANEIDALYWGLASGNIGDPRPNATTAWEGQQAPEWLTEVEGINGKHQDGDGNGVIDGADLQVVNDNFGNIHAYTQSVYIASTLVYELVERPPVQGDPSYDLYVTDASGNDISAHGLSAVIDFGDLAIDEVKVRIDNSSLVPSDTLKVLDVVENRFHLALTRTDGVNQLCAGPVANFIVITQDIPTGDSLKFDIENSNVVQSNGDMARVAGMTYYANHPANLSGNELIVNTTVLHEQCNMAGSIDLVVEGGEPPYRYTWNTGATSSSLTELTPNIYKVTITDNVDSVKVLSLEVQGEYISIPDEFGNLPDCINSPCPTLISPGGNIPTGIYKAATAVNSDGVITGSTEFKGGEILILRPGFEVPVGKTFSGTIEDCQD